MICLPEFDEALSLTTRERIYKEIDSSPGLHFREIQRRSNVAVGSLQYHLEYLQKRHLIKTVREGKFLRYYSVRGKQLGENRELMSLLRQDSVRKIILFLLQNQRANNIAISKSIGLSPSTTSWHLEKLMQQNLIKTRKRGRKVFYYLHDKEKIAEFIVQHRKSFFDELVDNFVDVWKELET